MTGRPLPLHATAALVMHWGYPAFSGRAQKFADSLDLSAARDLISVCESCCPWYGEVIANRKAAIRHLALSFLSGTDDPVCILIPAAGWSPLALDLLDVSGGRIQIIEIDIAGMEEKKELYRLIAPDVAPEIRCITADISCIDTITRYLPGPPVRLLVILEGITYFMDDGWALSVIERLSKSRAGYIIEYLLPEELIHPDRSLIADHVFSTVRQACSCPPPARYSPRSLEEAAGRYGYFDVTTMTVREMERLRTGGNRYFPHDSDGWIAITQIRDTRHDRKPNW